VSAQSLRQLATSDGNVLLFNAHVSASPANPILFPDTDSTLPDADAKVLFEMSSVLPDKLKAAAQAEGQKATGPMRGFVFNGDLVSVIRFLDIGTRVSASAR
jgi:hypothetical protein